MWQPSCLLDWWQQYQAWECCEAEGADQLGLLAGRPFLGHAKAHVYVTDIRAQNVCM